MLYCRCCGVNRDSNGKILSYNVQTAHGILTYPASGIRTLVSERAMGCYNLRIDKAGRISVRREPDLGNNVTLTDLIKIYVTRCKMMSKPTNVDEVYDIYMNCAAKSNIHYTNWEKYLIYFFMYLCHEWDIASYYYCSGQDIYFKGTNAVNGVVTIRDFASFLSNRGGHGFFPPICGNLKVINQSSIKYFDHLFSESRFAQLDLSEFNTENVIGMDTMFYNTDVQELDLSNFNTSKVTSMLAMFAYCSVRKLNLSSFDTHNVKFMKEMFYKCRHLRNLDIHHFNLSKIESLTAAFGYCDYFYTWNISGLDTSHVPIMSLMFDNSRVLPSQIEGLDTSNAEIVNSIFSGTILHCQDDAVLDLRYFNLNKCYDFDSMLSECHNLVSIKMPVISNSTNREISMSWMFSNCNRLKFLDFDFNYQNITRVNLFCDACPSLVELRLHNLNLSKLESALEITYTWERLKILRLGCVHTSKDIADIRLAMGYMKWGIEILDLSECDAFCGELIKKCISDAGVDLTRMKIIEPNRASYIKKCIAAANAAKKKASRRISK